MVSLFDISLISWMIGDATNDFLAFVVVLRALTLAFRRAVERITTRKPPLPPRPLGRGYPIFGNLPSFDRNAHVTLTQSRTSHGDLCSLRLGSWSAVVVSGQAAVKEAFVRHGQALASRPHYGSYSHYAAGKSISFQPYTSALKLHRRIALKTIKDLVCSGFAEEIVLRQVTQLTNLWLSKDRRGKGFDPSRDLNLAVAGGLYSMCYGREASLAENREFQSLVLLSNPGTELLAFGNPVDLIPWVLCTSRIRKKHDEYVKRMDMFLKLNTEQIRLHHVRQPRCSSYPCDDVMDAMIRASRQLDKNSSLTEKHLLNTPIEMLSAGSDTSMTTLLWLIYYMIKYPEAQTKIQAEIDDELGPNETVSYSNRLQLPYTEATILEVMRLRTIVPFGLPHFSTREFQLRGYIIPKHCLVFMNLWSVGRDKDVWEDPNEFLPERFLVARGTGVSVDESKVNRFYPFGVGRRRCVGEMLGRVQVLLFFANILHRCCLRIAEGEHLTEGEVFGDILKPSPYKICVEER
nr:NADPH-Cyrochrome P450 reductase [Eisenia fetida]